MADITTGRTRRMLSVGRLTSSVGGSYLWHMLKRPFQSAPANEQALLEAHVRNAERIVAGSKELRGAFMKLAQMLSMRSDLFPSEALEVLSVVQSNVPPMPWPRVRALLTEELGAPPERKFRRFEEQAFAAASLGQVHRAELRTGETVAVKVQYPGVADTVRQDVQNIKALLRILTGLVRDVMRQDFDRDEVAAELEARLHEELDYLHEADNLERFRKLLADDDEVVIPRVHRALSTRRVLTMTFVEGYPILDILTPGVDRELQEWVGVKLFHLLWRQVLEFGALHTDPHPGNYLVTHHPRLAILDFGSVRIFEPEIRRGYVRLARAIVAHDDAEIGAALHDLGFAARDVDPSPMVQMIHIVCEPIERDAPFDPRAFDVAARAGQVAQVAFAHRIFNAPAHLVFLLRTLLGVDGYLKQIAPIRNWHRIFRDIVRGLPGD